MKVYVVGLGPGGADQITPKALSLLQECDVIAGYTVYIDLIKDLLPNKRLLTTPMRKEVERCQMALAEAKAGNTVAMVSSGDAGVYGMAGLMHEVAQNYPEIEIEVIPGITAACSGAAVLGAPLIHDFAVISLSNLLTPWEKIEKRLAVAAQADFVICIYNPSSKRRADFLAKACDIVLRYQQPDVPVGIVRNIDRDGEDYQLLKLSQLKEVQTDMFTTVFIGNSQTQIINNKMVTPRGYRYQ
jgi:precorrin-3B C17-methyltransferase